MEEKKYLTAREAAQFLGYSTSYLYKMMQRKKIPYHQPAGRNGKAVFVCAELETWVEQGRQGQDPKADCLCIR